jgi:hypothetical protein
MGLLEVDCVELALEKHLYDQLENIIMGTTCQQYAHCEDRSISEASSGALMASMLKQRSLAQRVIKGGVGPAPMVRKCQVTACEKRNEAGQACILKYRKLSGTTWGTGSGYVRNRTGRAGVREIKRNVGMTSMIVHSYTALLILTRVSPRR